MEFYLGETGCPILCPALAYVECGVRPGLREGDHTLAVGEVVAAGVDRPGDPLTLRETGRHYGG